MSGQTVTTTAIFEAEERGFAQTTAALNKLEGAVKGASGATSQFTKTTETSAAKIGNIEREVDRLQKQLAGAPNAWREYERSMAAASRGFEAGKLDAQEYSKAIQQIQQQLQRVVAPRLSMDVNSSGLATLLGTTEKVSAASREAARDLLKQAEAQKVVEAEAARSQAMLAQSATKLKAELDPVGAAYARMKQEIDGYHQMAAQTLITQDELSAATARSRQAFDDATRSLKPANDNVKLTAGQVQNLGYQLNDTATMLAMGASPFQIIASQSGQVIQALGDGPGGVRGSLAAIGSSILALATPVNLMVAGFAALTAGAIYFGMRGRDKVIPLTDAMSAHREAVSAVSDAYGAAASKAAEFQKASSGVAAFNVRQSRAQLELSARASLNDNFKPDLLTDLFGSPVYQQGLGDNGKVITEVTKQFAAFEKPVLALVEGLEKGKARADLFVDAVAEIANLQPANKELQEAAKKLIDLAGAAAEAQRQMAGLGPAFAKAARDAKQFNDLAGDLGQFIPNRQTDAQRIEQTYQQMMRLAKTEADITRAQDLRRLSLEGLAEVETQRRAGYELDLRSITARSAAQKAQIEYERAYGEAIAANQGPAKAAQLGEEARALVLKQSQHDLTEAMNDRIRAGQQQVEQLQQEIDTFGKSAGEIARLTAETQLLTAAREAASQAGEIVDPAEEAKIREQAAAIGELTDRITRLNLGRDQDDRIRQMQAEAGLIGMNDEARRVALAGLEAEAELRRQGIPLNDAWGQSYVDNARQIATMEGALEKQKDAFEAIKEAASGFFQSLAAGEGIVSSLLGAFAKLGQAFATKGLNQLLDGVLGGASGGASFTGAITKLNQAANQNVPVYGASAGVERTFAAPIGAVERKVLPALSSFSTELTAAAKAIRTIESGSAAGNYSAMGPVTKTGDRAYGAYQVMGNNIADWSRSAIGREVSKMEFLRSVELQDKIFEHRFGGYMQKYGAEGASRAWFAGEGGMRNYRAQDVVGTSVGGYGSRFGALYSQHSSQTSTSNTRAIEAATARGTERGYTRAVENYDAGRFDPGVTTGSPAATGSPSGLMKLLKSPFGQGAMNAMGAFGAGVSGGPLSGALTGGLGAIGMGLGPLGIGLGVLAGVGGGLAKNLFNRKEREQAHQQAAAEWAAQRPAYEAFKRSLTGQTGTLREQFGGEWSQFQSFVATGSKAWKRGSGNSTAEFDSTGLLIMNRAIKAMGEFRESFDQLLVDVAKGLGSNSPFAKGTEAVKTMRANYLSALDDVEVAFGKADNGLPLTGELLAWEKQLEDERNAAVAAFKKASIDNALGLLDIVEPMSDVAQALDGYRGIAERMTPVLIEMGMAAEEAAQAVSDRFNGVLGKLRSTFEQGVADRLLDLQGKDYLVDARMMLEEFAQLKADAALLGADQSNFPELLRLQAQSLVDGAELTGDAFAELIRLFPDLSGVVVEAGKAVGASTAEIADAIKGYEERLFDAQNGSNELARIERKLAADRIEAAKFGADALAMFEKAAAAERANAALSDARNVLDRSYQAETDRINDLLNARRDEANELESTISKLEDFRDQVKEFRDSLKLDDNLSTLNAQDRVTEAGRQFRELLAKARGGDEDARGRLTGAAQEYLNEAKGYYQTSTDYGDIFEEVNRALADTQATTESALSVSQSQLDALKRQITLDEQQLETNRKQYEAILGLNEGIKSLEVAFREYAAAAAAARAAGITVPGAGGGGSSSGGANYDVPRVPGVNVSTESASYLSKNADVAAAIKAGETWGLPAGLAPEAYAAAHYGLYGQNEGRKWATGGHITGPGTGTSDSIPIWASNGEFMMREAAVSSVGVGTMDYINRTGRLPTIAMPASPRMVGSGNDNRGIEQRLDAMQRTLIALTTTTGGGLQRVAEAGEAGARATEQRALAERRSANNKQAA